MLRTVLARSARAVARPAMSSRTFVTAAAKPTAVRVSAATMAAAPRFTAVKAVRMYSAGGALNKDEVEGRIMSLLQGFDKVSLPRCWGNGGLARHV